MTMKKIKEIQCQWQKIDKNENRSIIVSVYLTRHQPIFPLSRCRTELQILNFHINNS